jgi:hypothetical protein
MKCFWQNKTLVRTGTGYPATDGKSLFAFRTPSSVQKATAQGVAAMAYEVEGKN